MTRAVGLFGTLGVLAVSMLAGCASGETTSNASTSTAVKVDGDFALALRSDPGSLDPHASYTAVSRQLSYFLYDTLVSHIDGKTVPQLASSWQESASKVTFTLESGITCADGTKLTAGDVAKNVSYVADPKNHSPLLGIAVPVGAKASADVAANTVTVTTAEPTGFLLRTLSRLPIVCAKGMTERSMLKNGSAGTGPYTLKDSVSGDHYTLKRRSGYTWGPDGATTATPGVPANVTVKVVSNETTAANLLLSGGINAATVSGPDHSRLKAAGLHTRPLPAIWGELLYNQAPDRAARSAAVRKGLTQALDLGKLRTTSTSGAGTAPKQLLGQGPCKQDSVTGSLPSHDPDAAKQTLTGLTGKKLKLVYESNSEADAATAELAVSMWKAAGVTVEARAVTLTELTDILFETGDWDIAWFPVDGQLPGEVKGFFSGPTPADGGNNVAGIHNGDYDKLSARASRQSGSSGCADWAAAEKSLMRDADVVPFSVKNYPVWGSHATFDTMFGAVVPTSVRVRQ